MNIAKYRVMLATMISYSNPTARSLITRQKI